MKICVVSSNYPKSYAPNYGAFVYNLCQKMALYNDVTVVTTSKIHKVLSFQMSGYGEEICSVVRPITLSLGNKKIGCIDFLRLTNYFEKKAVGRALRSLEIIPDLVYCHFMKNAILTLDYVDKHGLPLVVASGESNYGFFDKLVGDQKSRLRRSIDKVICVSTANMDGLVRRGFDPDKLVVIPNAVDYDVFKPSDKVSCKTKLGLDPDKFVVGFIGHFIERKGPNRLIRAIKNIDDRDIHLICVGSGGSLEENDFTTVVQPLPNEKLPEIYNAFDIFVLPTLYEGHCNAIEEAIACCVPVVSSKGTSVEKQLSHGKGLLVDPTNISCIAKAIIRLKKDGSLYQEIREKQMQSIKSNSLNKRAENIDKLIREVAVSKIGVA